MSEPSSNNFSAEELRCGCDECKGQIPNQCDPNVMAALQRVRDCYGKPMPLNSAYRCANHPREVSKENGPGTHHQGLAFDVAVPWGRDRMTLITLALREGFRGFGFANGFLHMDYRPSPLTSWSYS